MSDFEHCNLCDRHISSLETRALLDMFFCMECFDRIVRPRMVEVLTLYLKRLRQMEAELREYFTIREVIIGKENRNAYSDARSTGYLHGQHEAQDGTVDTSGGNPS